MVNEVKKVKVQSMVDEIFRVSKLGGSHVVPIKTGILRLVFDYDKLNEYGKIIVDNVKVCVPIGSKLGQCDKIITDEIEMRKLYAKEFVEYCRRKNDYSAYNFIFWSLMVLTVDDSNKEEYLSIICDFVKMFMITDEEVKDIVSMIKIIYGQSDFDELSQAYRNMDSVLSYNKRKDALRKCIKSPKILSVFSEVFLLYVGISGEHVS